MASNKKRYRKLTRSGSGSYYITLPTNLVRVLGWRERQKLTVKKVAKKLIIQDWVK